MCVRVKLTEIRAERNTCARWTLLDRIGSDACCRQSSTTDLAARVAASAEREQWLDEFDAQRHDEDDDDDEVPDDDIRDDDVAAVRLPCRLHGQLPRSALRQVLSTARRQQRPLPLHAWRRPRLPRRLDWHLLRPTWVQCVDATLTLTLDLWFIPHPWCIEPYSLPDSLSGCYFASQRTAQYCDEHVCFFVSVSARISQKPHGRTLPNVLCGLHVAVARSSYCGVAILYVLPVLWMTSCFHKWVLWHVMFIPKRREDDLTAETAASIPTKFCFAVRLASTHCGLRTQGEVCYPQVHRL